MGLGGIGGEGGEGGEGFWSFGRDVKGDFGAGGVLRTVRFWGHGVYLGELSPEFRYLECYFFIV